MEAASANRYGEDRKVSHFIHKMRRRTKCISGPVKIEVQFTFGLPLNFYQKILNKFEFFSFDGDLLDLNDTPAELDFEGGEVIDLRIKN